MGRKPNFEYLIEAGVPKYNAQILYWMFNHKKGGVAKMIVKDTGLSPSQVSIALNEMVAQDLLTMGVDTSDNGVGRKEKVYWLAKPKNIVLDIIVDQLEEEIDNLFALKFKIRGWME